MVLAGRPGLDVRPMSSLRALLLLLLLLPTGPCGLSSGAHLSSVGWPHLGDARQKDRQTTWLELTLSALESATSFFEKNYDRIILDGIFGLRVAEGQLVSALRLLAGSRPDSPSSQLLASRVARLQRRMHVAARASMPFLLADNEKYFEAFADIVVSPFVVPYSRRAVEPPMRKKMTSFAVPFYRERKGDGCFADLMGRSMNDNKPPPPRCTISKACYHMMTAPGQTDYTLTHQLLYFVHAQHIGCTKQVEKLFRSVKRLSDFEKQVCSKVYGEAETLSRDGTVQAHLQDLFLEQGVVCGMIGFESFLRPDWLKLVLSWQSPEGCFTDDDNSYSPKRFHGRHLLYEEEIEGGCLSHKSGLGTALLGIYARSLIEHGGHFPPCHSSANIR